MVPDRPSRRNVLRLSSVALLGLAGCSTRSPDGRESATATERAYSRSVDSPASSRVRDPEGRPAVRSSARSPGEDPYESSESWHYEHWLVTTREEADALDFSQTATGAESAAEFVADTDLARETLLVHQYRVGECRTRRPGRLEWDEELSCGNVECTGIELNYEHETRESDCQGTATDGSDGPPYSEGTYDSEATFVRIPAEIQSYGRFGYQV
jgi:hypothetical protein